MDNGKTNLPAVIETAISEQKINLAQVNLILPTQTFGQVIGEFDKVTIEVVVVDPEDTFEIGKGKKVLGKRPLMQISNALGIIWDPKTTGIIESISTKARAKATGAMKKPNGEWIVLSEEKTVDLEAIEEEQRIKQEEYAEGGKIVKWNGNFPVKEPWSKHGGEQAKLAHIEKEIRKALLPYRKFKDERAMTGAKERVIRQFVALKDGYTDAELSRPFAFPRVITDTSKMLESPEMRQAAIEKMAGSVTSIFGKAPDMEIPAEEASPEYEVHNGNNRAQIEEQPKEETKIPWETPSEETEEEKINREMVEDLQIRRKKYDEKLPSNAKERIDEFLAQEKPDMNIISGLIDQFDTWEGKLKAKGGSHARN